MKFNINERIWTVEVGDTTTVHSNTDCLEFYNYYDKVATEELIRLGVDEPAEEISCSITYDFESDEERRKMEILLELS